MTWPGQHRISTERYYRCDACEVHGFGRTCWVCGSDDLVWGMMPKHNSASGNQWSLRESEAEIPPDAREPDAGLMLPRGVSPI
jgi:hypothetical protein